MKRSTTATGLAAAMLAGTLALPSCGGSDPAQAKERGYGALGSGDYTTAVARFDEALEGADPASADYVELSIARCQALAHIDPERAVADFAALSAAVTDPARFSEAEVSQVVSELLATDKVAAVHAMDVGMKRFPDSERMKTILERVEAAAKTDAGAADALSSLGYGGGGD